jgi:hypothetical protein
VNSAFQKSICGPFCAPYIQKGSFFDQKATHFIQTPQILLMVNNFAISQKFLDFFGSDSFLELFKC